MRKTILSKVFSFILVVCLLFTFAACTSDEKSTDTNVTKAGSTSDNKKGENQAASQNNSGEAEKDSGKSGDQGSAEVSEEQSYENAKIIAPEPVEEKTGEVPTESIVAPKVESKKVTPDISSTQVRAASASVPSTSTEEGFADALEAFANPNGNEYDAIAILGKFRYNEDEAALMERFKQATIDWHTEVKTQVGEKCTVEISIKENNPIALSDDKVTQWNKANGKNAEDFANLKCVISSNYSTDTVTLSVDIVKINGNWHAANTNVIDNLKKAIVTHIFN